MDDTQMIQHLQKLVQLPAVSGRESAVVEHLRAIWKPMVDQIEINPLGSLQALAAGSSQQSGPSVMFAAHMDAIGLMVTDLEGEFIRATRVGGVDSRVLPGQEVIVHGRRALSGIIEMPPKSLLPSSASKNKVEVEHMLVDVGLSAEALSEAVQVGDGITFRGRAQQLGECCLAGPALDNRASIAALTAFLKMVEPVSHPWDVWAVATSQEELNMSGAMTSAYNLSPDVAVAIDVTFASGPGTPDHQSFPMDGGITLGWGPTQHPALYRLFGALAEDEEIKVHKEPIPARSGTDADALQITAAGIPTLTISIPLRYMHTPVEMVHVQAIQNVARLVAAFVVGVDPDVVASLVWDE